MSDIITKESGALTKALAPLVAERLGLQKKLPRVHDRYRVGSIRSDGREEQAILQRLIEISIEEKQVKFEHRIGAIYYSVNVTHVSDIQEIKNKLDFLPPDHEVIIRPVKGDG